MWCRFSEYSVAIWWTAGYQFSFFSIIKTALSVRNLRQRQKLQVLERTRKWRCKLFRIFHDQQVSHDTMTRNSVFHSCCFFLAVSIEFRKESILYKRSKNLNWQTSRPSIAVQIVISIQRDAKDFFYCIFLASALVIFLFKILIH